MMERAMMRMARRRLDAGRSGRDRDPRAGPTCDQVTVDSTQLIICQARHRYHAATDRYGRHASPIFRSRFASGRLRKP